MSLCSVVGYSMEIVEIVFITTSGDVCESIMGKGNSWDISQEYDKKRCQFMGYRGYVII